MISLVLGVLSQIFVTVGPGRCPAYMLEANTGSGWFTKNAYADSLMSAPKRPRVSEGTEPWTDTLWVSLSTAGGGTSLRCRCFGGEVSNVLAVVPRGSYARDTTMYASRGEWYEPRIAGPTRAAVWHGERGDTTAYYVETMDAEQSRRRLAHLAACGWWWDHGTRRTQP